MGPVIVFALVGLSVYAVLVAAILKRGREGRLQTSTNLLIFGGFCLVLVGGCLIASAIGPFRVSTDGSQELGFAVVVIGLLGGGACIVIGAVTALAGVVLKLFPDRER